YKEEYIDPASKFLLANEDVLTLEYDYLNKHYNKTNNSLAYADDISMYENSFDTKIILKYWDKEITDKLKKYQIYQKLINKYLRKKFPNYLINYLYYYQLLEQQKFQEVYVVGPYRPYIYAAASNLKIPKFEIQYAAIINNHPAYFDVTPHKKDLPDKIIVYDKVWKNNLKNYIKDKNNIILKSNKYFDENIKNLQSNIDNKENQILFVSQGTIGNKIGEAAFQYALKNPSKKVIYRLHPHETKDTEKVYIKLKDLKNVQIHSKDDGTVYDSMKRANKIIGVYSSVLYEAYTLEKKVYILKLPGYSYMNNFIEENKMKLIKSTKEI
ncbi:MAG: hypothetical protein ACK5HR_02320, partial [Mycoplasmatales bacterium]